VTDVTAALNGCFPAPKRKEHENSRKNRDMRFEAMTQRRNRHRAAQLA
jgi:hypothetical protein